MAIDTTVSGPNANSWVELADADTFADEEINGAAWTTARATSPSPCEAALITAARRISQGSFKGIKTESTQALAFPRSGLTDEDGYTVDEDTVPARVKRAQMKLAFLLVDDTAFLNATGLEGFSRLKVGPLEMEIRPSVEQGEIPDDIERELAPFVGLGKLNFRIVRG